MRREGGSVTFGGRGWAVVTDLLAFWPGLGERTHRRERRRGEQGKGSGVVVNGGDVWLL